MKRLRGRWGTCMLAAGLLIICGLLLWGLGLVYDPLFLMGITGATTALSILLLGWPWGGVVPLGVLAMVAPALARQPVVVFFSEALLLLGLCLIFGGARFLARRHFSQRDLNQRLETCYGEDVFENSLNIIHVIDREGNVVRRNRRSYELLGWRHKRTLHLTEYVHPEDSDRFRAELEHLFERGQIRPAEVRFVTEEKRSISLEFQGRRITGKLAVLEARDLTEIKALHRRLAEEEARYRYLIEDGIDTLDIGVLLVDSQGHLLWANRAVERFFGLDRDHLIGLPALRVLDRISEALSDGEGFMDRVRQAYQNKAGIEEIMVRVRSGGMREERTLQFRSIPIETHRYRGGRIDYFADITQLKRLEEELREQKARLEEANQRLRAFNSAVSHDLRSPTSAALWYIQLILSKANGELPPGVREELEKTRGTLKRMEQLLVDLNRFSSICPKPLEFEEVDLQRLLGELREDLADRLGGVSLQLASNFPKVVGVPSLLRDVFANLITNAVKFNDKALPVVEVGWKPHLDDTYLFWVRDNGPGIDPQYLEKIFELFEKLDMTKEGTGAGLAICRRILEEHGGRIWAESKVGQGTTFYFTLPRMPLRRGVESDAR